MSQWLMKLHTYGLLRNSFRPSQEIRVMRTYWRQRNDLVQSASRHILRMQKALTQMNVQLANVLTDISGVTGQAIIKAMAAKLARLVYRILRYGVKYVDQGAAVYEAQHKQLQIKQLKWKAVKLGFQIVQTPAA